MSYSHSKHADKSKKRRKSEVKDEIKAIVIDSGAYTIKIGHSTDTEPNVFLNCIMKAKSERKRLFIGNQIDECRDCSGLYFLLPCERGYVTKWDVQKPVWDHLFTKRNYKISEHPVVLTQPLFNFKSIQDCVDEIFFEEYEVPSLFRINPSDLAFLKYVEDNKKIKDIETCIVVDSGYSFTHIVPYINGNKYLNGIKRLNVGGKLLTNHLKDIISYRQYNVMEETYVINQVKEDTCYVSKDIQNELKIASKSGPDNKIVRNYVLPDFNNIRRGYVQDKSNETNKNFEENCQILRLNNERFIVPEILFHPSDIGMKSMGIAEAIVTSIYLCPSEHREQICRNVVLVGGNCMFEGFKDRVYSELRSNLPHLWELNVYMPENPIKYSWSGGNSLLKTPDFKKCFVKKEEYEELGSTIIQQRFNSFMIDNSRCDDEISKDNSESEIFRYLDKIKSRSIFGKQDPEKNSDSKNSSETSSISAQNENSEDSTIGSSEKDDLNQISEETSQESYEINVSTKKSAVNNNTRTVLEDNFLCESDIEDDITNSVDLFPFGTGSYL